MKDPAKNFWKSQATRPERGISRRGSSAWLTNSSLNGPSPKNRAVKCRNTGWLRRARASYLISNKETQWLSGNTGPNHLNSWLLRSKGTFWKILRGTASGREKWGQETDCRKRIQLLFWKFTGNVINLRTVVKSKIYFKLSWHYGIQLQYYQSVNLF